MRLHVLGICGTFMGGLAAIARAEGLHVSFVVVLALTAGAWLWFVAGWRRHTAPAAQGA